MYKSWFSLLHTKMLIFIMVKQYILHSLGVRVSDCGAGLNTAHSWLDRLFCVCGAGLQNTLLVGCACFWLLCNITYSTLILRCGFCMLYRTTETPRLCPFSTWTPSTPLLRWLIDFSNLIFRSFLMKWKSRRVPCKHFTVTQRSVVSGQSVFIRETWRAAPLFYFKGAFIQSDLQ